MYQKLYTQYKYARLTISRIIHFFRKLNNESELTKTTMDSYDIYQEYDNREQIDYETKSSLMLHNNLLVKMSFKEARDIYLEIDSLLKLKNKIKILEVGAGNCINLYNLKLRYDDKIELFGLDISENRIKVAKEYFGSKLDNIEFTITSITSQTKFDNNEFDIVFSMHCLEQISYNSHEAVAEMYRITKYKLLMVEPVFENGNFLQKLYLIDSDHNRTLLKNILELQLPIVENKALSIQSNPSNQSSFLKIEKTNNLKR